MERYAGKGASDFELADEELHIIAHFVSSRVYGSEIIALFYPIFGITEMLMCKIF